jgi:uncharacterized protein YkwD
MIRRWTTGALALVAMLPAACSSDGNGLFDPAGVGAADGSSTTADTASGTSSNQVPTDPAQSAVCVRWNADRAFLQEGRFTGDIDMCTAGTWDAPGPENTLRQVNLYRWMAGLEPVTLDAEKSVDAQACAVMMDANEDLAHDPPSNWDCRGTTAVAAAGLSNIATTAGVFATDLYMVDAGVQNLGHRRWILSNSLGPIGVGSTSAYSCLHVIGGRGAGTARWTAWPPPGDFPLQAGRVLSWTTLDRAGWSIQSDQLDLRNAQVTVRVAGEARPISVQTKLGIGYGSTFGIRISPEGWTVEAGEQYDVSVRGIAEDIDYSVNVLDCSG